MVRARIRKFLASPLVDAAVRIIVVLSVAMSGAAVYQNRDLTRCVARYNNANNARSVALTQATDLERAAERAVSTAQAALFLSPILNKPGAEQSPAERAEVRRLFRAYQVALSEQSKERATADDARRDHPIPDPPNEVCD
jgi:hypothetical protein